MANANTITKILNGDQDRILYYTMVSDGSEETDLKLYDSSDWSGTDSLNSSLMEISGLVQILDASAVDVSVYLEWDADTDVHCMSLPINRPFQFCFTQFGGLKNVAGTGKTGDINLTTTGMETGDRIFLVARIKN